LLAVNERRHGIILYMPLALSVRDLCEIIDCFERIVMMHIIVQRFFDILENFAFDIANGHV